MKRPKITDFTPDYTKNKGALYVQYTIAQDKYIDYLENEVEKLNLLHVSKHRELLIAFCRFLFTEMNYTTETEYAPEEQVDVFIESNFHNIEFILSLFLVLVEYSLIKENQLLIWLMI